LDEDWFLGEYGKDMGMSFIKKALENWGVCCDVFGVDEIISYVFKNMYLNICHW